MKRARPLLGTFVEVTAEGSADVLPDAIRAAFASIEDIHRLMSFHDPNSDVSRINGAEVEQEVGVDPHTFRVLDVARRLSDLSEGVFDITIAPVLVESGFLPTRAPESDSSRHHVPRSGLAVRQPRALAPQGLDRSRRHRQRLCSRLRRRGASFARRGDRNSQCRRRSAVLWRNAAHSHPPPERSNNADASRVANRRRPCELRGLFFRRRSRQPPHRSTR